MDEFDNIIYGNFGDAEDVLDMETMAMAEELWPDERTRPSLADLKTFQHALANVPGALDGLTTIFHLVDAFVVNEWTEQAHEAEIWTCLGVMFRTIGLTLAIDLDDQSADNEGDGQ